MLLSYSNWRTVQSHLYTSYSLSANISVTMQDRKVTVCTVVQNCCNGRSKKYRKWHFWPWGCSLSETLQRIYIKFGRDDYVGDGSQYAKWHINRLRGVISAKGWIVNGLCFFIFFYFCLFFSAARGQTVGPILTSDTSKCVFLRELHSFWG